MSAPRKILFLIPYPLGESPSQRFRFEQYFELLHQYNYVVSIHSFFGPGQWKLFYSRGQTLKKIQLLAAGFLKRGRSLFQIGKYDLVFIHREATPLGFPLIEWWIAKIKRKKIVYDFDDAIWTTDRQDEPVVVKWLKYRSKVKMICSWAYRVSCGNSFLCEYARRFASDVILNPSTIDLHHHVATGKRAPSTVTIGWTGSHSTLKYLGPVIPVIERLLKEFSHCVFLVIADRRPPIDFPGFMFQHWNRETEIEDLSQMDIGMMPLPDDEWSRGKCGFKALQYMALGVPAVASPVGVNRDIIREGHNGFLCASEDEWYTRLRMLIEQPELRETLGTAGKNFVSEHYSSTSNAATFLSLFA